MTQVVQRLPSADDIAHYKLLYAELVEVSLSHAARETIDPTAPASGGGFIDWAVTPSRMVELWELAQENPSGQAARELRDAWQRSMRELQRVRARHPHLITGRTTPTRTALQVLAPWLTVAADRATGRPVGARQLQGEVQLADTYVPPWVFVLTSASAAASAYHGWRRTRSWGWTMVWALFGGLFPIITPAVALAQGYGKRAR